MTNIEIHDQTKENYDLIERTSRFYLQKLEKSNFINKDDSVQIWLEKVNHDFICKLEVKMSNQAPLFFRKTSKKANDSIKEAIHGLQYALSSRDQIWKTKSHSSNYERTANHIQ